MATDTEREQPASAPDFEAAMAAALAAVEKHAQPATAPQAELPPPLGPDPTAWVIERRALMAELDDARRQATRLQQELDTARSDLGQSRRRVQRLDEELEELRRRLQRQELDLPHGGARRLLAAVLPALDDLEATCEHLAHEALSFEGRQALAMVRERWHKSLQTADVQAFDAIGQRFDPAVHEVIAQTDQPGVPTGTVVRQVGRGYLLAGKLVRSARVVVVR
jgi:molecular chaperone GrpE